METKNGLVVVLTISETPIFSVEPAVEVVLLLPPQAERLSVARVRTAPAASERRAADRGALELNIESPGFGACCSMTTLSAIM
jgi:hypothetical protein